MSDAHLCEHGAELLVGVVVAALREVTLDLVPDLLLVEVPRVVRLLVGAGGGVWRALDEVDGGAALLHDLVGEALRGGEDLCVVLRDEVLHDLLQLLAGHLQQRLRDGHAQGDALGVADAEEGEGHHVLAPEDVAGITAARHRRYLAPAIFSFLKLMMMMRQYLHKLQYAILGFVIRTQTQ